MSGAWRAGATGAAGAARKGLHALLSLGAAAVVYLLPPTPAAIFLAAATMIALVVELARRMSPAVARAFGRLGGMLKAGEEGRLTGATTLSIGFTVAVVLLPGTALGGILAAGLGDPAAALVGGRYGRLRYPGGKSVAGSAAFLVVTLGIGLGLGLAPGPAVLVAAALTAVEALALPIDDNVYLPLAGAAALSLGSWLTPM